MGKFEYAPAPESRDVVALRESYGLFIDGDFVPGMGDGVFKTISPATEEVLAEVTEASPADVDRAVSAARKAYEQTWSVMPGRERAKYLFRIARIIQERARELAVLESLDNGKPIRESRDVDIPLAAAHFFYYAGWADKLEHAGFGPDPRPLGVAGQVIPWNFPLLMLAWKIAPALACGNTVVLKPAETTPLTALLFAEICQQADLPPGVVNIVTGAGPTGRALVTHPGIDKVAFTGSTEVGKEIARAAGRKKVTLELGGKAANIVFADAPVDQAVEGIVNGIFFNQGHVCCAGSRLLVQESVYDQVLASLRRRLATLRLGDPLDKNTDVGAINSPAQLAKIRELSDSGEAEGAERWSAPCELPVKGFWFPPTVFTGVSPAHRIAREEIFGPVLSVLTFRTPAEAIAKANNTPYGLSAGVWTDKGSRILWMAVAAAGRGGVGQHLQQVRPDLAVRRLQGVRLRPRGRPPRLGGLPRCLRPSPARAAGRAENLQALHRRGVPALGKRKVLPGDRPQGQLPGQRGDGLAQGRPGRGHRRAQGGGGLVRRDRVQPGAGAVPGGRTARGTPVPVHRRGSRGRGPRGPGGRDGGGRRDRPLGLVRRLGRQDLAGPGGRQPGRGALLQLLGGRGRPASPRCSHRRTPACSVSSRWWRPPWSAATP